MNDFISDGKKTWRLVRNRISEIFEENNKALRDNDSHKKIVLFTMDEVEMQLPVQIGDYTDFFSSKEHASNVGTMLRGADKALLPNWLHMPVAYHGRSSSVIPSGTPIHRPQGQTLLKGTETPILEPSKYIDFELEMAFITTDANLLGEPIPINEAEEYIFGMVLSNDWSARDIQKWESDPLGPFLAKNFASSISPWIVTMDALEPFRIESPKQNPKPLPYLKQEGKCSFDINLQATIIPENSVTTTLTTTNFKHLYWSIAQQLTHHTINGCSVKSGDLMGSGTISGSTPDSYGSMLELTWGGKNSIILNDGTSRKFIEDNDTVTITGFCEKNNLRIGFGEVHTKLLPVFQSKKK